MIGAMVPTDRAETDVGTVEAVVALLRGRRFAVLTGAGCSTESGIPDYRGAGRDGRPASPILHDAFLRREEIRQRYWARSTIGWARFSRAAPNPGHRALAAMEAAGLATGVITQNVDRLHHRAGSRTVVELHGALAEVGCLGCGGLEAREDLQARLLAANPGWLDGAAAALAPDGDAELAAAEVACFRVPACLACGGVLKPAVVFFGGTVAPATVAAACELLDRAEVLLVVGTSLAVYSGFRFVRRAAERAQPVALVNVGTSRADELAAARVEGRAGEVLPRLAAALCSGGHRDTPEIGSRDGG